MKNEHLFAFIAFFLMSLTAITGAYAIDGEPVNTVLTEQKTDLNGDQKVDKITLEGIPFKKNKHYFQSIFLKIDLSNGKSYKKKIKNGLEPELTLVDLNHDGLKDIFLSIPTGQNSGHSKYYLYSVKASNLTEEDIPGLVQINAQFSNGYKAKISIPATKMSYELDLMTRKGKYEQLGMYYNGKLNEPTELMVHTYGKLKPHSLKKGEYGLIGVQKISGTSKTDTIAFVKSIWYFEAGLWKLKNTEIREAVY